MSCNRSRTGWKQGCGVSTHQHPLVSILCFLCPRRLLPRALCLTCGAAVRYPRRLSPLPVATGARTTSCLLSRIPAHLQLVLCPPCWREISLSTSAPVGISLPWSSRRLVRAWGARSSASARSGGNACLGRGCLARGVALYWTAHHGLLHLICFWWHPKNLK